MSMSMSMGMGIGIGIGIEELKMVCIFHSLSSFAQPKLDLRPVPAMIFNGIRPSPLDFV